jgi:hypothetical protein
VRKVSTMPDQQSRFSNPDLKVYAAEILIDDKLPDVKPGLSARAEVIITNLLDVIKVPVQCVTSHQGKQVCYVQKNGGPEPVTVIVGMFNHKFIEVQEGLSPGDKILLSPPLDATTEGMEDTFVGEGEALPKGQTPAEVKADQEKAKQDSARKREGQGGGKGKGGFDRAAMMKRFDKDNDGKLSDAEQKAMRAAFAGGQKGGSKGSSKGGQRGGGKGGQQGGGGGQRGGGGDR